MTQDAYSLANTEIAAAQAAMIAAADLLIASRYGNDVMACRRFALGLDELMHNVERTEVEFYLPLSTLHVLSGRVQKLHSLLSSSLLSPFHPYDWPLEEVLAREAAARAYLTAAHARLSLARALVAQKKSR